MSDIYLKIREGTRSGDTDLCLSCCHSTIVRGAGEGNEKRFCQALPQTGQIFTRVADCSGYYNRNLPSIQELQKTAWILTTSKSRKIGFEPYADWRAKHRDEDYPE